jgi:hypothetical protein
VAVGGWPADGQRRLFDRRLAPRQRRSTEVASGRRLVLRNKKQEWEEYRSEVTAFELRKNLPVL